MGCSGRAPTVRSRTPGYPTRSRRRPTSSTARAARSRGGRRTPSRPSCFESTTRAPADRREPGKRPRERTGWPDECPRRGISACERSSEDVSGCSLRAPSYWQVVCVIVVDPGAETVGPNASVAQLRYVASATPQGCEGEMLPPSVLTPVTFVTAYIGICPKIPSTVALLVSVLAF